MPIGIERKGVVEVIGQLRDALSVLSAEFWLLPVRFGRRSAWLAALLVELPSATEPPAASAGVEQCIQRLDAMLGAIDVNPGIRSGFS